MKSAIIVFRSSGASKYTSVCQIFFGVCPLTENRSLSIEIIQLLRTLRKHVISTLRFHFLWFQNTSLMAFINFFSVSELLHLVVRFAFKLTNFLSASKIKFNSCFGAFHFVSVIFQCLWLITHESYQQKLINPWSSRNPME